MRGAEPDQRRTQMSWIAGSRVARCCQEERGDAQAPISGAPVEVPWQSPERGLLDANALTPLAERCVHGLVCAPA